MITPQGTWPREERTYLNRLFSPNKRLREHLSFQYFLNFDRNFLVYLIACWWTMIDHIVSLHQSLEAQPNILYFVYIRVFCDGRAHHSYITGNVIDDGSQFYSHIIEHLFAKHKKKPSINHTTRLQFTNIITKIKLALHKEYTRERKQIIK